MMKARFQALFDYLNQGLYEREEVLKLSLLAALAGEGLFLLGRPGLAKSLLARRLKLAFTKGQSFEYLMSRFSTPDEIFGPVSITALKDHDRYERVVEGYLPTADVVFLDEIWKAGPAIQNALLTVLNEKRFRNGQKEMHLPLKLLLAASNELPSEEEDLSALYDRFLLRVVLHPINKDENFAFFIQNKTEAEVEIPATLQIKKAEWQAWQREIDNIHLEHEHVEMLVRLRDWFREYQAPSLEEAVPGMYVSDRRWYKLVRLLRASAFLHDRKAVNTDDFYLLIHGLWDKPEEREMAEGLLQSVLPNEESPYQSILSGFAGQIQALELKLNRALVEERRTEVSVPELIAEAYYEILGNFDVYPWMIYAEVYERLSEQHLSDVYLVAKHAHSQRMSARARRLGKQGIELQVRGRNYQLETHSCMLRSQTREEVRRVAKKLNGVDYERFEALIEDLRHQINAVWQEWKTPKSQEMAHWFAPSAAASDSVTEASRQVFFKELGNLLTDLDKIKFKLEQNQSS